MVKNICILGSTGSIGTQCLDVVKSSNDFNVYALSANKNIDILKEQIRQYTPKFVCITDEEAYDKLIKEENDLETQILFGLDGLVKIATAKDVHIVVNALVGNIGILPTIKAIENKKTIALANKETLVSCGELIMRLVKENNVSFLPVDSEHSAIFQCLQGNKNNHIKKIYLTASGGPFRTLPKDTLEHVKPIDALKHPNWKMGSKITIDSATLMNKGLEVIEAKFLFHVDFSQIEVLVHPQSIVHSLVEFEDSSILAQMGLPDMRVPIGYALNYPNRDKNNYSSLDFFNMPALTFERARYDDFPCLNLAIEAGKIGGTMGSLLNAANEELVYKFLNEEIAFTQIPLIIEKAMSAYTVKYDYNLQDVLDADAFGRNYVNEVV